MLKTGQEHLESLRDGRVVYIGSERVEDVIIHPAFRNAARTVAAIYDMKADPANRETLTYEEDGGRHSIYYLRAKTRDDLQRRMIGHRKIADLTYGMFGRSPDQKKEAITCAVPCNTLGLSLWSRKSMEAACRSEFDSPLAYRYDETDSMVMCDQVKVPWENVLGHDDAVLSRDIYLKTPSHCFGNHQSNVRYWSKMRLLLGLCSKVAHATGADQIPAVRETLGKMSSVEGAIAGMVNGQINAFANWREGYVCFNRRMMYAALDWCTQNYTLFIDQLRDLCGGGVFQMPADSSVMEDEHLAEQFDAYFQTPQADAVSRMKLFKLAWDMVGSEFAGRHQQYEKFYAGASFIVRGHAYRETPWDEFDFIVDELMASYGPSQT